MSDFQVEAQHVSTTEDEMTQAANIFAKMRDAVIDASHLAGEVAELRKAVGDLRREVEVLRRDNHWLDEQLTTMRKSRDDAMAEAGDAKAKLHEVQRDRDQWSSNHARISDQLISMENELLQARKDRDDEAYRNLELSEELEKVKAKLAKVMAVFSESETSPKAAEIARPAQAEPSHDPVPMSQASGDSPWPPRNW